MITPAFLLDPSLRDRNLNSLRRWGERIGLQARDALATTAPFARLLEPREARLAAVSQFFGLHLPSHAFHVEPHRWLRVTETQATRGFAHFIRQGGSDRALAFLKAVDRTVAWPRRLTDVNASAEVPAGSGRIDLLVTGGADGRVWGAVIEAKFGHDLKSNPLAAYAFHGKTVGLTFGIGPTDNEATGRLVVLALKNSRTTAARLTKNRRWRLLHWSSLLRRLERELADGTDDDEFRRFRRTLWDRIS